LTAGQLSEREETRDDELPVFSWKRGRSLPVLWVTPLAESNHIMR
jgi:hypothetical protein